jgi:hypothetical protein
LSEELSFSELMKKLSEQGGMLSEEEFLRTAKLIQLTPERELRAWENALFSVRRYLTFKVQRTQSIDDALLLGRALSLVDVLEARYEILREQEAAKKPPHDLGERPRSDFQAILWQMAQLPPGERVTTEWLRTELDLPENYPFGDDLGQMRHLGYILRYQIGYPPNCSWEYEITESGRACIAFMLQTSGRA